MHLIHPLGFDLEEKNLRRAGLDYMDWKTVTEYSNLSQCLQSLSASDVYACSTKGNQAYDQVQFKKNDALLFGPETRGLPEEVLSTFAGNHVLRIPMIEGSRSLNLSNTVAVVLYEAWRQNQFAGSV